MTFSKDVRCVAYQLVVIYLTNCEHGHMLIWLYRYEVFNVAVSYVAMISCVYCSDDFVKLGQAWKGGRGCSTVSHSVKANNIHFFMF